MYTHFKTIKINQTILLHPFKRSSVNDQVRYCDTNYMYSALNIEMCFLDFFSKIISYVYHVYFFFWNFTLNKKKCFSDYNVSYE